MITFRPSSGSGPTCGASWLTTTSPASTGSCTDVSQRTIAARTGQSQSEISEIVARHRQVHSYELLVRIAEGLGIPRGWMGLAYDESTQPYVTLGGDS